MDGGSYKGVIIARNRPHQLANGSNEVRPRQRVINQHRASNLVDILQLIEVLAINWHVQSGPWLVSALLDI
jgi:hypothetical protein